MDTPATATPYVPVAITDRSGVDESLHAGAVVVLDAEGGLVASAGDHEVAIYPRSSMKPIQADAMLGCGLTGSVEQLAVACASHAGSPMHLDAVRSTLGAAGVDESALRNTPDWPRDDDAAELVIAAGGRRSSLMMNCSGKHAAMISTCVANGWPIESYLDQGHPLQRAITEHVATLGATVHHIGVDGCGAPAHMISLRALADAYRRLAGSQGPIWAAMTARPDLIAGEGLTDTRLMRAVPGLMCKGGAEGVIAAALPGVGAVAVKIGDGAERATGVVAAAWLSVLGVDVDAAASSRPILGHGQPVGRVRPISPGRV